MFIILAVLFYFSTNSVRVLLAIGSHSTWRRPSNTRNLRTAQEAAEPMEASGRVVHTASSILSSTVRLSSSIMLALHCFLRLCLRSLSIHRCKVTEYILCDDFPTTLMEICAPSGDVYGTMCKRRLYGKSGSLSCK